jgi:hypothetical protein
MKPSRISICNLIFLAIILPGRVPAQACSARLGLYEFTDITAREVYINAPALLLGFEIWRMSRLDLQLASGIAYNRFKYNSHHHNLFMVPLTVTLEYDLDNSGANIRPAAGMGLSFMEKIDSNKDLAKTHYSFAYGYHAQGGIRISLSDNLVMTFDLTWNLLLPPVQEDININGILVSLGIEKRGKMVKRETGQQR